MGKGAKMSESITLIGKLRLTAFIHNKTSAEINVRGDIVYRDVTYRDLPIVRLMVSDFDGEIDVEDEYATMIPYFKPVAAFRSFLISALPRLENTMSGWCVGGILNKGIAVYVRELSTFSDVKSLVSQAKTMANMLDAKKKDAETTARAVLSALGKAPMTDTKFYVVTR